MHRLAVAIAALLLCACSRHEAPADVEPAIAYPAGMTTALGPEQPQDGSAAAEDPIDCGKDKFQFATSLSQLPGGMRNALSQRGTLADREEDYDSTDARRGHLPTRHFDGAAINGDHVFAVVNDSGFVLATDIWAFERHGSAWTGNRRWSLGEHTTLNMILQRACKQYALRRNWTSGALHMRCNVAPRSGLFSIEYEVGARHGDFEVRAWDPQTRELLHEPIIDALSGQPASPAQLAQFSETLRAARVAMRDEDDCRFEADAFLSKLDAPGSGPVSAASR